MLVEGEIMGNIFLLGLFIALFSFEYQSIV